MREHGIGHGCSEGLEERVPVGEVREVALVLGVDPGPQRLRLGLGHDLAHDARDERMGQEELTGRRGEAGAEPVVENREPRQDRLRSFQGGRRDGVDQDEATLADGGWPAGDHERAERMTEDDRVARGVDLLEEGLEPGRVVVERVATLERCRRAEPWQVGRDEANPRESLDDRKEPVVGAPEAMHQHDGRRCVSGGGADLPPGAL